MSFYRFVMLLFMLTGNTAVSANDCVLHREYEITVSDHYECKEWELTPSNNYNIEIKLTVNRSQLKNTAPLVTTKAELPNNPSLLTSSTFMDVVAYTDTGPSIWSYGIREDGQNKSRYLYVSTLKEDKQNAENTMIKLVFSTTTKQRIKFELSVELRDISIQLDRPQNTTLSLESPVIYKYENKENKFQRIRVHTTRTDIDNMRNKSEVKTGCSIATIQQLDTPFHARESDITFDTWWQTMIGRSVIDVDIGPGQHFEKGFYIVILKKKNETNCHSKTFDLSIAGNIEGPVNDDDNSTRNETEIRAQYTIYKINIKITKIDHDYLKPTGIVLAIFFGLFILIIVLSRVIKVPIAGTVFITEDIHQPVSIILKLLGALTVTQRPETYRQISAISAISAIQADDIDSSRPKNEEADTKNEQTVKMDPLSKPNEENKTSSSDANTNPSKPDFGISNIHHLHSEKIQNAECIYIDLVDSDESESGDENNQDAVDGITCVTENQANSHYTSVTTNPEMRSRIKAALNIDKKRTIRIVAKGKRSTIREHRKQNEPKLDHLATKCDPTLFPQTLFMKSDMYYWILILSGIFYLLPAVQLMFAAQNLSTQTGSQDLCYYNYLCRVPSKLFSDYGHIFSNVAYIFCGTYFIALVLIRRHFRRDAMIKLYCKNKKHSKEWTPTETKEKEMKEKYSGKNVEFLNQRGIPEQYGIYLAMGGALILEGIMSACYHVCPVDQSFQFDTTFMYITTVLIFLKLYQFRHPDITSNANIIFLLIALMLVFEAVGYNWQDTPGVFMFFFIATYLTVMFCFIIDLYFHQSFLQTMMATWNSTFGGKSINRENAHQIANRATLKKLKTGGRGRTIFFIIMGIMNIAIAIFFIVKFTNSIISNYLLVIFGANMAGYAVNYAIMKCYYVKKLRKTSESISWTCWIYIILAVVFCGIGLYYFKIQEKTTLASPSESRHLNDECTFWIFDKHDIWHFTSAFGLFFIFMMLLTLEDNNTDTPWSDIPVF